MYTRLLVPLDGSKTAERELEGKSVGSLNRQTGGEKKSKQRPRPENVYVLCLLDPCFLTLRRNFPPPHFRFKQRSRSDLGLDTPPSSHFLGKKRNCFARGWSLSSPC